MNIMGILIASLILSLSSLAGGDAQKSAKPAEKASATRTQAKTSKATLIEEIRNEMNSGSSFVFETTKKTTNVLGTEKTSKGSLAIRAGKVRWDVEAPEKQLLLFDGRRFVAVQYPLDDDENLQVTVSEGDQLIKSNVVMSLFDRKKNLGLMFQIKSQKPEKGIQKFLLKPRSQKEQIQAMNIEVNVADRVITKISYEDEIGSATEILMAKKKDAPKLKKSFFKYDIPKDAKVTRL